MRLFYLTILLFLALLPVTAQETTNKITYQFYGFVRGDATYDTRLNASAMEGLLLLYPLDVVNDANGKDLNEVPGSGFYTFNSRAGVNVSGLKVFDANATARIEGDFAGFGGSFGSNATVLRIRHAFIKMQWQRSLLTIGQTWHPFFSSVYPDLLALAVGAPFCPFNRSPQLRFDYKLGPMSLTGAGIYQFQSTSTGPLGKTTTYQRTAIIPELFVGTEYSNKNFIAGIGVDYLTIKPRTTSLVGTNTYKVDESLSSLSFSAYAKYTQYLFTASARSIYGQNLSDMTMLGGYGISNIDGITGEQKYTNFNHSSTWINVTYGKKYMGGIFAGYTKNLGTDEPLANNTVYGEGLKINNLYRLSGTFTYNIPHFSLGLEYEMTTADYGNNDPGNFNYNEGTYYNTHAVTNHRVMGVISYLF